MTGALRAIRSRQAMLARRARDRLTAVGLAPVVVKAGSFDAIYRDQDDPWAIGDADSQRYTEFLEMVRRLAPRRRAVLDIGSGMGAPLARFRDDFDELVGVELAGAAMDRGRARFPFIRFVQGSAANLNAALPDDSRFDAILYSDVISYLRERHKRESLRWIARHLEPAGVAVVNAWCPGGRYLTPDELRHLLIACFEIAEERVLPTGHAIFACRALADPGIRPNVGSTEARRRRRALRALGTRRRAPR